MDFTPHFFAANQPYQFTIGIPPLTPSHSNSAASEDFNTTSPPVCSSHPLSSGSLASAPSAGGRTTSRQWSHALTSPQEVFDGFTGDQFPQFDGGFGHFNAPPPAAAAPHGFPAGPPTPPNHQLGAAPHAGPQPQPNGGAVAAANIKPHPHLKANGVNGNGNSADEHQRRGGSNSEEDELTPAQSRRKAQNRAA